ncbi:hypothetical protein [Neokomagataea thailandica]|uniref:Uncharacterized protein n=1 Tax=Neokomagataea tanensis NBRC 106556 TaxID=1223519 RepID=A0ABQ0QKS4_9PROT|nr:MULTISPECIES: hypothetical protein [Neokomagataea]GBR48276.1 hypothetical protein AA106556_1746 [Neokomagataea tanensis NBRC 106556]
MTTQEQREMDALFPHYSQIMRHVEAFFQHPESRTFLQAHPDLGSGVPWFLVRLGTEEDVGLVVDGTRTEGGWDLTKKLTVLSLQEEGMGYFRSVLPGRTELCVLGDYAIATAADRAERRIETLHRITALTRLWASDPQRVADWHQRACVHNLPAFPQHIASLDYGDEVIEGLVIGGQLTPKGTWSLAHDLTVFCETGAVLTVDPQRAYDVTISPE